MIEASASRFALVLVVALAGGCAGAGAGSDADLSGPMLDDAGVAVDLAGKDLTSSGDMASSGPSCNPANETLGANGGPDSCNYGEYCDDVSNTCQPAPAGSCNMVLGAPVWAKGAKAAPVIAKVSATLLATTNSTTECANGDPAALVTVDYYAPMDLTATTNAITFLSQVKFKKSVVSSDPWFSGTFMRAMPAANAKFGSFKVGINCGGAGGSVKTSGFYIVDAGGRTSNVVCVSW